MINDNFTPLMFEEASNRNRCSSSDCDSAKHRQTHGTDEATPTTFSASQCRRAVQCMTTGRRADNDSRTGKEMIARPEI